MLRLGAHKHLQIETSHGQEHKRIRAKHNHRRLGLIDDQAWSDYQQKQARMASLDALLTTGKPGPEKLRAAGLGDLPAGQTWAQLLKRPQVGIDAVFTAIRDDLERHPELAGRFASVADDPVARAAMRNEARAVETEIKFAGYLEQQRKSIAKLKAAEAVVIPQWLDYAAISGLSRAKRLAS